MNVVNMKIWEKHLENCQICRKAIQLRFAGVINEKIYNKCCEIGKPLYKNFINENNDNELQRFIDLIKNDFRNWMNYIVLADYFESKGANDLSYALKWCVKHENYIIYDGKYWLCNDLPYYFKHIGGYNFGYEYFIMNLQAISDLLKKIIDDVSI